MSEPALPIDTPVDTTPTSSTPSSPASSGTTTPSSADDFFSAIDSHFEDSGTTSAPKDKPAASTESSSEPEDKSENKDTGEKVVSPKAKDFKLVKEAKAAAEAKVSALESRVKELEAAVEGAKTNPEYEAAKERLALVEKELAAHRIEATPEYSKVVLEPLRVIQDSTERLIAKYKLDRDRVIDAMAEADPAAQTDLVADVAAGMNELDRMRFYQMVDDFSQVLMKREQLRTNAEAAWREIEASRAAQSEQFRKQTEHQWKDNAEKIWDKLKSKIPGFESLPKIDEVRATVFDPANAQQAIDMQVYSLAAAHLVPRLAKTLESRQSRIEELEAALAKYKSATPSAGAGGTTDSSDEDPSADFLSSLEKRFR